MDSEQLEFEPNKYDNDLTLLYKRAQRNEIPSTMVFAPSRFLFRRLSTVSDPEVIQDLGIDYQSVFDFMTENVYVFENGSPVEDTDGFFIMLDVIPTGKIISELRANTQLDGLDMAYLYYTSIRAGPKKYQEAIEPRLGGWYLSQYQNLRALVETLEELKNPEIYVRDVVLPGGDLGVPQITALDYYKKYSDQPIENQSFWRQPATLAFLATLYGKIDEFSQLYNTLGIVDPSNLNMINVTRHLEGLSYKKDEVISVQKEILRKVNEFLIKTGIETQYSSFDILLMAYNQWLTRTSKQARREEHELYRIISVQKKLASVDTFKSDITTLVPMSPLTMDESTYSFSPLLNGEPVTPGDGLDIFNQARPSIYVPHIKYIDSNGGAYHRLYTGDKAHPSYNPNYMYSMIPEDKNKPNTMYLHMWLGINPALFSRSVKHEFYIVEYQLDNNYMRVLTSVGSGRRESEYVAISRLKESLPSLDFGKGTEVNISGNFLLWGESLLPTTTGRQLQVKALWLEMSSFLDLMLTDDVMGEYLYLQEISKPYAVKKQLRLHYKSLFGDSDEGSGTPSIKFSLSNRTANNNLGVTARDYSHKVDYQVDVPRGLQYYYVSVTNAASKKALERFMLIVQLLFRYYLTQREHVYSSIYARIPELVSSPGQVEVSQISVTRIEALHEAYPEMFGNSYPATCTAKNQPQVITANEIEYWQNRRKIGGLPREVLTLHNRQGEEIYLVCPDDNYPYPGYKRNTKTDTEVPCCRKSRAVGDKETRGFTGGTKSNRIVTSRVLDSGGLGSLPTGVDAVLRQISTPQSPYSLWSRYGVPGGVNSFLHCILNAVNDPEYIKSQGSESYVYLVRQRICDATIPALLSQELYDYTSEEALTALKDQKSFFDPQLFYRSVEEYLNVNIYVFSRREKSDPGSRQGKSDTVGFLEIPRYRMFHARPIRVDRPTILLFKSIGSKRDNLEHPHCELIVTQTADGGSMVKYFGEDITRGVHGLLMSTLKTYTFDVGKEISAHSNLGYLWDTLQVTSPYSLKGQHVDPNGKMRIVDLIIGDKPLSLVIPPTQPENLPLRSSLSPLYSLPQTEVVQLLGQPTGRGDKGLWFSGLGLDHAIYVAVKSPADLKESVDLPFVPDPDSLDGVDTRSDLARMTRMRRTINIIVELVSWLFSLFEQETGNNLQVFRDRYMKIDTRQVDSADYYDLSRLSRRLPRLKARKGVEIINEALEQLEASIPTLVRRGKLLMYSKEFEDRLVQTLLAQDPLPQYSPVPVMKEHLYSYFESDSDFKQVVNSKVFISDRALRTWSIGLNLEQNNLTVLSNISDIYTTTPFIYRDRAGRMFLIQGVHGGRKETALAVSFIWNKYHVNPGPSVEQLVQSPAHVVYGVLSTGELQLFKDNSVPGQPFLSVLYYETKADLTTAGFGKYAAMLRLL